MESKEVKKIVKECYSKIAGGGCCSSCGCGNSNKAISKSIGYSEEEMELVSEANLGLGCGNPLALAKIKEGDVVVDLGSGAGFDAFLASKKVGENEKVVGIDMTEKMIKRARENAKKYNFKNVEFKLGDIEKLPLKDNSVDAVISNCVINLAPDKDKVFSEAFRILKKGGRMFVSDIVLLEKLSEEKKKNQNLIVGCVGGALLKENYIEKIKKAGFEIKILSEDKDISKRQYSGIALESIKVEGVKR